MTRRLMVLVLAVLLAAGCGSVPTSGPIRSSNQAGAPIDQQVEVNALPPLRNAKPPQIVSGFLEAMAHPRNFDIARQYLTREAAANWRPELGTSVYGDSPREQVLTPNEKGNYVLNAPLVATLDSRGSWRPAPPGKVLEFEFELEPVMGEWRISKPPAGVYINSFLLENNFERVNLYFFNLARDRLIPDPVYLPTQSTVSQRASQLTKALLAGPTNRLGRSVANLVPQDTQVNVSVPVDLSSVATVSLNEPPARLGPNERSQLAAQIAWTLNGISIRAVRLTANGAPLVDGGQEEYEKSDYDSYAPTTSGADVERLYVLPQTGSGIGQVTGIDGSSQPGETKVASLFDGRQGKSLAVDLQGNQAAMVAGNEVLLGSLREKDQTGLHHIRTEGEVLRPSFDLKGNLWVVDRANRAAPRVRRIDQQTLKEESIAVAGLRDPRSRVLRVAPDGVRVLLVVGPDGHRQVTIGRVTGTGTPPGLRLEGFEPLHLAFSDVADAGWSAPDRITVLGTDSASHGVNQPLEAFVDGSSQRKIPGRDNFNLIDLAVSPASAALLVVRDENQRLHVQSKELSWSELLETGEPVYPG